MAKKTTVVGVIGIIIAVLLAFALQAAIGIGVVLGIVWILNTALGLAISYVMVAWIVGGIFALMLVIKLMLVVSASMAGL